MPRPADATTSSVSARAPRRAPDPRAVLELLHLCFAGMEGRIDLPFLVQRQCRDTARTVGLFDRGVLAPGYRADLNVIDFEQLRARRPEVHEDLPAGGRRLLQRADGYLHTVVAGQEIMRDGEPTGALPGRLVRGPQATPA